MSPVTDRLPMILPIKLVVPLTTKLLPMVALPVWRLAYAETVITVLDSAVEV